MRLFGCGTGPSLVPDDALSHPGLLTPPCVCVCAPRSNCFKPDYLQIAVMDPFLLKFLWFKCPTDGGKLHIPK